MKQTFYKGVHGNLSIHTVTLTLVALAASESVVLQNQLPIGTQIVGVRHVHESLGANTEATVEIKSASGASTNLTTINSTSAGAASKPIKPIYIGDDGPSDLLLKNTGSDDASGEITVQLEYRYIGY